MTSFDWLALALTLFYGLALYNVLHVLQHYRTAQSAIGWITGLIAFPYLALPLYLLIGRYRFEGYVASRRTDDQNLRPVLDELAEYTADHACAVPDTAREMRALTAFFPVGFTQGNRSRLLVNGAQAFPELFAAIEEAQDYILLEFYIVRDDNIGRRLSEALLQRLKAGVSVYFLYDDIGSAWLSRRYIRRLREAGAHVRSFNTVSKRPKRFQINFRNHRKILVADGRVGLLGGMNIGQEYLGLDPDFTPWRDTHLSLRGPAVQALQLVFLQDWYWSANTVPSLNWKPVIPEPQDGGEAVLILPTSAADLQDTAVLFYMTLIQSARHRLWIASPYFVPDQALMSALSLAVLRGVDVRILIPNKPDNRLVQWAAYTHVEQALEQGVKVYSYIQGFMHQKVMLVDDRYACVGTANLDNRSLRLNFEVTSLLPDRQRVEEVRRMLEEDFRCARPENLGRWRKVSRAYRLLSRAARLLGPIL